jgi:hypothetical protein
MNRDCLAALYDNFWQEMERINPEYVACVDEACADIAWSSIEHVSTVEDLITECIFQVYRCIQRDAIRAQQEGNVIKFPQKKPNTSRKNVG